MVDGDDVERGVNEAGKAVDKLSQHPKAGAGLKMSAPIIAALVPLVGIMLGIAVNTWSEHQARADEKASREREEQIRRVGVGLETYQSVAEAQARMGPALEDCTAASFSLFDQPGNSAKQDLEDKVETACAKARDAFTDVEVALGQAVLVSPNGLLEYVDSYKKDWVEFRETWSYTNDFSQDGAQLVEDLCEEQEDDEEAYFQCYDAQVKRLPELRTKLENSGKELSASIRDLVLLELPPLGSDAVSTTELKAPD